MLRRIVAAAAVIALMVCSGTVGALAFSSETVVEVPVEVPVEVQVEVPVEVPVEQETVELEAIGLTLILPDSWKGKYYVEYDEDGEGCCLWVKFPHKSIEFGLESGYLFWVGKAYNEPLTPEQLYERSPVPCIYLFATADATYRIALASDVAYDPHDPVIAELYTTMYHQVNDIKIVVDNPAKIEAE